MKRRRKLFFALYQVAGELVLTDPEWLTPGQRDRLNEVLLDALSDPDRHTAKGVADLARMAKRT